MSSKVLNDPVQIYINKVQNNEILVPEAIQQAIDRHINDLKKVPDKNYKYTYDVEQAIKAIKFIEMLPDPVTLKRFPLAHFQQLIVALLHGWREKDTGYRRFRKAYISLARKQGKTLLAGGLASYHLLYEKEPYSNRQIYCTANSRDQAKILFDQMIVPQLKVLRSQSDAIRKHVKIKQGIVTFKDERAFIKPLASDTQTLDGLNVSLGILDEYGASRDSSMLEILESSQLQQLQPLILIISTATEHLDSPMYSEEYPYAKSILTGKEENDRYLALIWEQDHVDEVRDKETWIKSNPILEVPAMKERITEFLEGRVTEGLAKGNPSMVYTKNFNLWTQSSTEGFMNAKEWELAKADKEYDLNKRDIYIGLDLSKVGDLTSVSHIIPIEEERKLLVDSYSFVATREGIENKCNTDGINYVELEKAGYCKISTLPSGYIDYDDVLEYIDDLIQSEEYNLRGIYYDPYNITTIHSKLLDRYGDSNLIEVRQGYITLSPAVSQFRVDVAENVIVHKDNPLLNRAVLTAKTKWQNDALMIEKSRHTRKIDPLAALLNAHTETMLLDFNAPDANDYYMNNELF